MKKPSHPDEFPVAIGQDVCTSDGQSLGGVIQVLKSHFEVESPKGDIFWLSKDTLEEGQGNTIHVGFPEHQLEEYWMKQPAADAAKPMLDEALDAFPDKAAVEKQLAAQARGYDSGRHEFRR
jgi:hypothetical protein